MDDHQRSAREAAASDRCARTANDSREMRVDPGHPFLIEQIADSPIVAAAVHDGAALRPEVAELMALGEAERRREEDPFTAAWTRIAPTRLIGRRSRFEVDLNRPPDKAVFRAPEDAWGLHVWRSPPPAALVCRSKRIHEAFYAAAFETLRDIERRWDRFVVLDLHSYNHRRAGPHEPPDDPLRNPEVNIGTGSMDRQRWASIVERCIADLRAAEVLGRPLDVRENVRFLGGYFSTWVHRTFPASGCALAIEVKKFFMDEWTGVPDAVQLEAVERVLASTVPGLLQELGAFA